MKEVKFSCMWSDGDSWMDLRYTLDEMCNGDHLDAMSDQPMLRKFKLKHKRQYTGVKGRNDVEIYEGDILRIKDRRHKSINVSVIFEPPMFKMKGNNSIFHNWVLSIGEVIGNIYENPELLESE